MEETKDIVVVSTEVVFDEPEDYIYSLVFLPPNIIVSVSFNAVIYILDIFKKQKVSEIKDFSEPVRHVLKLSNNSFIASSDESHISGYRIINHETAEVEKFLSIDMKNHVRKLLLLHNKALFLSVEDRGIHIVNSETQQIVKTLDHINTNFNFFGFGLSRKSETFFIQPYPDLYTEYMNIRQIKYNENKTIKEYKMNKASELTVNDYCYTLVTFVDSRNQEILVSGLNRKRLAFYNTESSLSVVISFRVLDISCNSRCLSVVKDRFLFIGNDEGGFEIVSLEKREKQRLYFLPTLHKHTLYDMKIMNVERGKVSICTGSADMTVKVVSIECVLFDFGIGDEDELERINYLKENYCDCFCVKFWGGSFLGNRVFLCL